MYIVHRKAYNVCNWLLSFMILFCMCLPFITKTLVESQPVWRDIDKSQTYVRVLLNNLFYIEKKPLVTNKCIKNNTLYNVLIQQSKQDICLRPSNKLRNLPGWVMFLKNATRATWLLYQLEKNSRLLSTCLDTHLSLLDN